MIYKQTSIIVQYTITLNVCSKSFFILHCVVFKIKLLTGVLCTSPILLHFVFQSC